MSIRTIKLSFLAPVHFGNGRLSDNSINCDAAMLFSALYIEALNDGCSKELYIAATEGNLTISDAFPFIDDVFYLPKPMTPLETIPGGKAVRTNKNDSLVKKAFKKLSFVPASYYNTYFAGDLDPFSILDGLNLGEAAVQTKVNLTNEEKPAEPYHVGSFSFHENAGLYFLVDGTYEIEPLLKQLQYSGLGGERSSGYGRFFYSISDINPLEQVKTSGADPSGLHGWVLLASAAPKINETTDTLLDGASYNLVRKSGFVQSQSHSSNPQKKRDFYTFAAGSFFNHKFDGAIYDVNTTPNAHPVYRYARAMWLEV